MKKNNIETLVCQWVEMELKKELKILNKGMMLCICKINMRRISIMELTIQVLALFTIF